MSTPTEDQELENASGGGVLGSILKVAGKIAEPLSPVIDLCQAVTIVQEGIEKGHETEEVERKMKQVEADTKDWEKWKEQAKAKNLKAPTMGHDG